MQDVDVVNNTIMGEPAGEYSVALSADPQDPAVIYADPPMMVWDIYRSAPVSTAPVADAANDRGLLRRGTHLHGIQQVRPRPGPGGVAPFSGSSFRQIEGEIPIFIVLKCYIAEY